MSRSYRVPIIKDKPRNYKRSIYYRRIRRAMNQFDWLSEEEFPNSKSIVNDYDYCDYVFDMRDSWYDDEYRTKASRK